MKEKTKLRLKLLENGYTPLANVDKRCMLKGWPSLSVDAEMIKGWDRVGGTDATGIRVENGLAVVDIDINDADVVEELAVLAEEIFPALADQTIPWLTRHGKGAKEAWFFRCDEPFGRIHTRTWLAPGTTAEDGQTATLEIFGGASAREFGSFGWHTRPVDAPEGSEGIEYRWRDESPLTAPLGSLPVFSKEQFHAFADGVERILEAAGWQPVLLSQRGEQDAVRVYDLTEEMSFDCNDEVTRSLSELRDRAKVDDGLRCSASWFEGPQAKRTDRCLVSLTRSGHVAIYETASGVTHVEAIAAPVDHGANIDLDRLAELLQEATNRRKNRLNMGDDFDSALLKILGSYAWCPPSGMVVPMWPTSITEGERLPNFRVRVDKYSKIEVGPRGGEKRINPANTWQGHEELMIVEGVQMRPDQPRPVFEEGGKKFLNAYRPVVFTPEEADSGTAGTGWDFMERLVPDPDERKVVVQWLAHKLRFPWIPMYALVMVAHNQFGTGRNTFGDLCGLLLGQQYVREVPFETFAGKTYQAQYNDWQVNTLMVVVSESSEVTDGSAWNTKRNSYERLKLIVDPRPGRPVMVNMKGLQNYYATTCASYLIATNHADALPIPENDRRFCVIRNGDGATQAYWAQLRAWMDRPENIAAFAADLAAVDLSDFQPYDPPLFEGKIAMADEAKSDLDLAFEMAVEALPGELVTVAQMVTVVRQAAQTFDLDLPRGDVDAIVKRMTHKELFRIGIKNGQNWRTQIGDKRVPIYSVKRDRVKHWTLVENAKVQHELRKNGDPAGARGDVVIGVFAEKMRQREKKDD